MLRRRGLTDKTIREAGLWSARSQTAAELLGFNPNSGGLIFPYWSPLSHEVVLNRVRPDTPPLISGKPAKYLSPKNTGNRLYFAPDSAQYLRDPSVQLLVTNGELKY